MSFEKWVEEYNLKKITIKACYSFIKRYKLEYPEKYNKLFKGVKHFKVLFLRGEYVIDYSEEKEKKYILGVATLEKRKYCDFAEYYAVFDLNGELKSELIENI